MIWLSLVGVFLLSIVTGAIFKKIPSWTPGTVISLPIAYFIFQNIDNRLISQGYIFDLFSFFSSSGDISETLSWFVTFAGGVGIWGLTSIGVTIGKRIGSYIVYTRTKRRV